MPADTIAAARILRPTRAEIRLSAVRKNLRKLKSTAAPARLLFVVKANAYGHGAVELTAWRSAKTGLGLRRVSVEEGLALRAGGITSPVLVWAAFIPLKVSWRPDADLMVTIVA